MKETFKNYDKIILFLILVLAATLRFKGIHWGIPTVDIPHVLFHPDEVWELDVLKEFNFETLSLNPVQAHREGTFSFYVILLSLGFFKLIGYIKVMPYAISSINIDYERTMLVGRFVTGMFDLFSLLLIYFSLKNLTKNKITPLVGAFIFSIMPFEIIHSHFLRAHIYGNFGISLVIYLSTLLYKKHESSKHFIAVGLACGLAAAARYTLLMTILIPLLIYLGIIIQKAYVAKIKIPQIAISILKDKKIYFVIAAFFLGFFIIDPFLFLKFGKAKAALELMATYTAKQEFSIANLLNLSRVWVYVSHLIPFGNLPFLWVMLYFSFIYLIFRRALYAITLPFIFFTILYLYPMAKGYAFPDFIRATLPLFPVLAILTAITFDDLFVKLKSKLFQSIFIFFMFLICVPTLMYDWAYVGAMSRDDSRVQLFKYFNEKADGVNPIRIGLFYADGYNYFMINPVLDALGGKIKYTNHNDSQYLVFYASSDTDFIGAEGRVAELKKSGNFELIKIFDNPIKFYNHTFKTDNYPHDLLYPFPKLYLMKKLNNS